MLCIPCPLVLTSIRVFTTEIGQHTVTAAARDKKPMSSTCVEGMEDEMDGAVAVVECVLCLDVD